MAGVSTVAGSKGAGFLDGSATSAKFSYPHSVAVRPTTGEIIVAEYWTYRIRSISTGGLVDVCYATKHWLNIIVIVFMRFVGIVSTIAGSAPGYLDGLGTEAKFNNPVGVAVLISGVIVVSDFGNNMVRSISTAGTGYSISHNVSNIRGVSMSRVN